MESMMDNAAKQLGIDPDTFRQQNLYKQGQVVIWLKHVTHKYMKNCIIAGYTIEEWAEVLPDKITVGS